MSILLKILEILLKILEILLSILLKMLKTLLGVLLKLLPARIRKTQETRSFQSFQIHKAGNHEDEYEDAWQVGPSCSRPARIALCDGASESAFARNWAQILSDAFVNRSLYLPILDEQALAKWLEPCQTEWSDEVPWENLPWHGEAKTRAGAMATLLGMELDWTSDPSGALVSWQAVAVGDSCLFIVRDDALAFSFPVKESSEFNTTPSLICSVKARNGQLWKRVHQEKGKCFPGDMILLASDGISCWFLKEHEDGRKPWDVLLSLYDNPTQWNGWIEDLRSDKAMRNDDTTLIVLKV